MFGFNPKPPIDEASIHWIKDSYRYFGSKLGNEKVTKIRMVLPVKEDIPGNFDGSFEETEITVKKICEMLEVDYNRIELTGFKDHREEIENRLSSIMPVWSGGGPSAAGYYSETENNDKVVISIKKKQFTNPMSLVATVAHEICHYIMLKQWQFPRDREDMEPMTDLLTIFLGFGIFTANSSFHFEQFQEVDKQGWRGETQGYLLEEAIGYALAEWAFLKKDTGKDWQKYLCTNGKAFFKQSMKYIQNNIQDNKQG
jgi:hypothetical protein